MILELSLTAPEHAHLIEHYHDFFHEQHSFEIDWNYPVMPRIGESFDFPFISGLLQHLINITMLPKVWTIVDLKWHETTAGMMPRLYVVGK
jgi:hypothetical protein